MQTAVLQTSAVIVLSRGAMLRYEPYRGWHRSYIPVRLLVLVLQVSPLCSLCLLKSKASHQYPVLLGKHERVSLQKGRARSLNPNIYVLPEPSIQKPNPAPSVLKQNTLQLQLAAFAVSSSSRRTKSAGSWEGYLRVGGFEG